MLCLVVADLLRVHELVHAVRLPRDDEVEGGRSALGALGHCEGQFLGGRRLVGYNEDMGGLRHDSPPG
jgi:hypothetical protein